MDIYLLQAEIWVILFNLKKILEINRILNFGSLFSSFLQILVEVRVDFLKNK